MLDMVGKADRRKSGPKTLYDRNGIETIRLSRLAKDIVAAQADRCRISAGEFWEHLARTRAMEITPQEIDALR